VRGAPVPVQDMNYLDALSEKVICEKEAMASLRCSLGTHETGATHPAPAQQLLHSRGEFRGVHVVGVVAKGSTGEGLVGRLGAKSRSSQAAQMWKPRVRDPCLPDGLPERFLTELGVPS
jgi:hypothetical protein